MSEIWTKRFADNVQPCKLYTCSARAILQLGPDGEERRRQPGGIGLFVFYRFAARQSIYGLSRVTLSEGFLIRDTTEIFSTSLLAQTVKNLPAMWETWVRSLGWEDLEEGMATHSSILAWRIPRDRGASWATAHEVTESQA